uniref:Uncharacterized protein n=1 Tax=Anguilla anguilla TaxID=7936 RepID=A0A0E9WYW2_ANGAN
MYQGHWKWDNNLTIGKGGWHTASGSCFVLHERRTSTGEHLAFVMIEMAKHQSKACPVAPTP